VTKILNWYNTNTYFHSFVLALEAALISFATSYSGGLPTNKSGWVALASALGGAVWGALKRWLSQNVATVGVEVKK
jgi:hypothetical protein